MNGVVVTYFAGTVPEIANLHFLSFIKKSEGRKYILFLDNDLLFSSKLHPSIKWIENHPDIQVKYFDLHALMRKHNVPGFRKIENKFFRKLLNMFVFNLKKCCNVISDRSGLIPFTILSEKLELGTSKHDSFFSNLGTYPIYRSELFRSLIALEFKEIDVLYVDLDICFLRSFSKFHWNSSFTSQWGTDDFANTACLFFAASQSAQRLAILDTLIKTKLAWTWDLYSKNNCENFGIEILNISHFDPPWTPGSLLEGKADDFFLCKNNSLDVVAELKTSYFLAHWHNRWSVVPELNSPFDLLIKEYSQ